MKMLIMQEKENASNTPDVRRVANTCTNQITKDKLISKQEAMCLTGSLSFFTCLETIETVSLLGYKKIDDDGTISSSSYIDLYAKRENKYDDQSFYTWICERKTNNKSRAKTAIPHFVSPNSVTVYPITKEYARYILMVYKPWTNSFDESMKEKTKLRNTKGLLNPNSVLIW